MNRHTPSLVHPSSPCNTQAVHISAKPHMQMLSRIGAITGQGARSGHVRRFTTSSLCALTQASLRTYQLLHGDALVPRKFVVPEDPEWQPECHGIELGRLLRGVPLDATYNTSTHQWDAVVQPELQRYFEQRQADPWLQENPEYADELCEFGLGMLISFPDMALHNVLQDIIFRGHFVSGYPERVEWLRNRGVDVEHCGPEELPGAWNSTACPWQWCDGDESLHYMLCLESKYSSGSSWSHTIPCFSKQQQNRMFSQLQGHFNMLDKLDKDGRINADQVGRLVQLLTEIAVAYGVHGWDETQYAELLEYKYDNHPDVEEAWEEFRWLVDIDMEMGNPWGEVGGRYRDNDGAIISSPMWEGEKAYRTSPEGLASLRFSCHDTPGYVQRGEWVPLQ